MCLFLTQIKACAHTFSKHRHHPPALLPSFLPHSRTSLFFPSSSNHQSWKPIAKLRKPHQLTPPTHTPTKLSTLDPFWLKKSLARQAAEQWIRHERFSHPLLACLFLAQTSAASCRNRPFFANLAPANALRLPAWLRHIIVRCRAWQR